MQLSYQHVGSGLGRNRWDNFVLLAIMEECEREALNYDACPIVGFVY